MPNCPVCATDATAHHPATPYWICQGCACWFQWPQPPKVYEAAHEAPGDQMSEHDRRANDALAGWLVDHVMGGKIGDALDIGAKYPYLASRLKARGYSALAIDGIGEVGRFGEALGVPVIQGDFEAMPVWPHQGAGLVDLLTLVHCLEHFYDPLAALFRIRKRVRDDGRVFIRLPDHDVKGFERDLTPGHFTIHPFFWNLSSILEALAQLGDCFVIEETRMLEPGQRDIVLRPITVAPQLAVGMIARNEERDIVRALASTKGAADAACLIDTGSTDATRAVARELAGNRTWPFGLYEEEYTEASERDAAANWKLLDFSKARNRYVDKIEAGPADWLLWLDADDELLTPRVIRRATYDWSSDVYGCWIQSGGSTWITHRLWKTGRGIRFAGRCHEYPVLGDNRVGMLQHCLVRHDATPGGGGEESNARNLRMLTLEWQDQPSPRTAFYLANTHKDGARWTNAITWYNRRIEFGPGFRDEWLFSWLYRARCERAAGLLDAADATCIIAGDQAPDWMEFVMERARIAYQRGEHAKAIELASRAVGQSVTQTVLWREVDCYTDAPLRLISWCYEHQGKHALALEFAERAAKEIRGPDVEWADRITRLTNASGPFLASQKQAAIALCRPGAIGDVLMTLNLIPALRDANPGLQVHYFTSPAIGANDALGGIMRAAGVDLIMDCAAWGSWRKNYELAIDLVGYPLDEGYPERPMRKHLLQYFAGELGLTALEHKDAPLPALTLRRPPRPACAPEGGYITLQVDAGWSKYKEFHRWAGVVDAMPAPYRVVNPDLTPKLSDAIALVANARMHIGIDSFCNHLTNFFWTDEHGGRRVPGVILWGSTQASAAGYPHNVNLSLGLPCQPCFRENPAISAMPRGPCVNPPRASYDDATPHACMGGISVERVVEAVRQMWERTGERSDRVPERVQ